MSIITAGAGRVADAREMSDGKNRNAAITDVRRSHKHSSAIKMECGENCRKQNMSRVNISPDYSLNMCFNSEIDHGMHYGASYYCYRNIQYKLSKHCERTV